MKKLDELKRTSMNAHLFMEANLEEDANTRWIKKCVKDSIVLYDGTNINNVTIKEGVEYTISHDLYKTNNASFMMKGDTTVIKVGPRPVISMQVNLDNINLEKYNRLSFHVYPKAIGFTNFYCHFGIVNDNTTLHNAPSVTPNKWNHVVWEIDKLKRDKVKALQIACFMMGTPPEALSGVEFYIDSITADIVDTDYDLGWDIENRIAYSHVGYFPNAKKIAVCRQDVNTFKLFNSNNELVLEKEVKNILNDLGSFTILDFSEIRKEGEYYLKVGNIQTPLFDISELCYDSSIWKSMNFLRLLRCGEDVPGVHSPCHLNCRTIHEDGRSVPNFGGWHDAGDVSQFEICTAEMAHAILDLAEVYKEKENDLYLRLLEEARVGINWLLRTRFGDGQRAMAVLYNVWRDNVLTVDDEGTKKSVAENGPFENFTASAAEAKAAIMFKEIDPIFSDWCRRSAIEDFKFAYDGYKQGIHTKRWGSNVDSQVAGHGILAACELYLETKDEAYLKISEEYAQIVLSCQETIGLGEEKIKGFFYEDPLHKYILTYEHRGHEQSPIHGIVKLMEVYKKSIHYLEYENCIKLYKEYIIKTKDEAYPYGMLPGHIYILDKFNMERFTVPPQYGTIPEALIKLQNQAKCGRKIEENVYLRKLPVSIQRRGFHATLLSKTKAVSMIARILQDEELKQICIDQFEWMFGRNPFASSTMYGEGHNYHPLYVAFSPQMVGALPVGIETLNESDEPYWPIATQAVYKEIWGHTTGKYLWVLADIIGFRRG